MTDTLVRPAPQLAAHATTPLTDPGFACEPKLDGWRLLAHRADDGVHLYTRDGNAYTGRLPLVEAELLSLPPGTWIDGEAVSLRVDEGGRVDDWGVVQSVLTTTGAPHVAHDRVTLMAFDLIAHAGIDARPLPYAKRRELLEKVFDAHRATFRHVALVPSLEPTQDGYDALLAQGFEGAVYKRLDAAYASGKRGRGWVAVKPQTTAEAFVTGYKPGENGFTGLVGALAFGQVDPATGEVIEIGRCSGFDMRTRRWITENIETLIAERQVFEFAHLGWMKGAYRSPQWKRWRQDRNWRSVLATDAAKGGNDGTG